MLSLQNRNIHFEFLLRDRGFKITPRSDNHCKAIREASSSTKTTNYFVATGCRTEDEVTAAKGTYAFQTVEHNICFYRWIIRPPC